MRASKHVDQNALRKMPINF